MNHTCRIINYVRVHVFTRVLQVQQGFHTHLAYDVTAYAFNPRWTPDWPALGPAPLLPGSRLSREVIVYNDAVQTAQAALRLRWSARWDNSTSVVAGGTLDPVVIPAGGHARLNISAVVPTPPATGACKLWLLLETVDITGQVLFSEDKIYVNVTRKQ